MYRLIITELAHQDLDNIVSYIAVHLSNPKAAIDFLNEVDASYRYLKNNPMIYAKCQDKWLEAEGYRKVVIKNYVAVYKISEDQNTVSILRFFYSAQDYMKLI